MRGALLNTVAQAPEAFFFWIVTVYVWRRPRPSEPAPSSAVMAGGMICVPGATGEGEFDGAAMPLPAPMKPVKTPGSRNSGRLKRNWIFTSSSASKVLSTFIS